MDRRQFVTGGIASCAVLVLPHTTSAHKRRMDMETERYEIASQIRYSRPYLEVSTCCLFVPPRLVRVYYDEERDPVKNRMQITGPRVIYVDGYGYIQDSISVLEWLCAIDFGIPTVPICDVSGTQAELRL